MNTEHLASSIKILKKRVISKTGKHSTNHGDDYVQNRFSNEIGVETISNDNAVKIEVIP